MVWLQRSSECATGWREASRPCSTGVLESTGALRCGQRWNHAARADPCSLTAAAQDLRSAAEWRRWEHVGSSEPWQEHKRQVSSQRFMIRGYTNCETRQLQDKEACGPHFACFLAAAPASAALWLWTLLRISKGASFFSCVLAASVLSTRTSGLRTCLLGYTYKAVFKE